MISSLGTARGPVIALAAAVLFLLRDAKFTTGQILNVDGGRELVI